MSKLVKEVLNWGEDLFNKGPFPTKESVEELSEFIKKAYLSPLNLAERAGNQIRYDFRYEGIISKNIAAIFAAGIEASIIFSYSFGLFYLAYKAFIEK